MLKNEYLSKSVSDVSFAKFKELLTYKAKWYDKTLILVDRHFPSSQICSSCRHQNPKVKNLGIREWICPICHAKHDRDYNASLNILKEGQRIYSLTLKTVGTTGIA